MPRNNFATWAIALTLLVAAPGASALEVVDIGDCADPAEPASPEKTRSAQAVSDDPANSAEATGGRWRKLSVERVSGGAGGVATAEAQTERSGDAEANAQAEGGDGEVRRASRGSRGDGCWGRRRRCHGDSRRYEHLCFACRG